MSDSAPRVSSILLTWNCAPFVEAALRSVLAQECEPMEVLVSDDASTDDTFALVASVIGRYRGPHHVRLLRRTTNSGSKSAHLNEVIGCTDGEVLVSFDGDDIYDPTRVHRLVEEFRRDPSVMAVYSGYSLIDGNGRPLGKGNVPHPPAGADARAWFARVDAFAAGSTLAVRRAVFDVFGALDPTVHEDVILPFRASLLGEVRYIDASLVQARRHAGSLTAEDSRFASFAAYRERMLRGIERARRHRDLRLSDLEIAAAHLPTRRDEFAALREVVHASMAEADRTAGLVSASMVTRLVALWRVYRAGAYREEWVQHLLLATAPELYLRHKRRQRKI